MYRLEIVAQDFIYIFQEQKKRILKEITIQSKMKKLLNGEELERTKNRNQTTSKSFQFCS